MEKTAGDCDHIRQAVYRHGIRRERKIRSITKLPQGVASPAGRRSIPSVGAAKLVSSRDAASQKRSADAKNGIGSGRRKRSVPMLAKRIVAPAADCSGGRQRACVKYS